MVPSLWAGSNVAQPIISLDLAGHNSNVKKNMQDPQNIGGSEPYAAEHVCGVRRPRSEMKQKNTRGAQNVGGSKLRATKCFAQICMPTMQDFEPCFSFSGEIKRKPPASVSSRLEYKLIFENMQDMTNKTSQHRRLRHILNVVNLNVCPKQAKRIEIGRQSFPRPFLGIAWIPSAVR